MSEDKTGEAEGPGRRGCADRSCRDGAAGSCKRRCRSVSTRRPAPRAATAPLRFCSTGAPPKRRAATPLPLPTLAAAEALADEWARQEELIDPITMPMTRIANSAIDGVAAALEATAEDIAQYGASDLVCYRAGEPEALAKAQAAHWDKVLDYAREKLGARLICAEGVNYVEQPEAARRAILAAVKRIAGTGPAAPFALAALHVMTTLTGSALLALAVADGVLTPQEAWTAAHVDEDFQAKVWGADEEALARRARRWTEMEAAARLLRAVRADAADRATPDADQGARDSP